MSGSKQTNETPRLEGQVAPTSYETPILAGPPKAYAGGIVGTGVISTLGVDYWVSSTGATNVWSSVSIEQGKTVSPFYYSTPIINPKNEAPN